MFLYIDPGTGSMLFTVLFGLVSAAFYSLRMLYIKLMFKLSSGKVKNEYGENSFVIFSDDKRYWTVFEPVCKEMDSRGKDILYLTASEDDPVFTAEYPHLKAVYIGKNNKAFALLNSLNSVIVLSTTPSLDVYQWKRSKGVKYYVHMLHSAGEATLYEMFGIDYYDAVLLSGKYQEDGIRRLEELRGLPEKELEIVGIPYFDDMYERIRNSGEVPEHPTTVLLAPSWGKSALLSVYGGRIIDRLLSTGYHIIIRPHPQSFTSEKDMMYKLMRDYPESEQLEWNRDPDNFDVLRRADIMISDFSGVIYDFSLIHEKPVIYTNPNYDKSPYDAWWLDKPIWKITALPRLGKMLTEESLDDLKGLIDDCLTDNSFTATLNSVRDEAWSYRGEGAKNVASYLIRKYDELTALKEE